MERNHPTLNKMKEYIKQWKSVNDSRYIFLSCYYMMSSNMLNSIENEEFHDSIWVGRLLNKFADYYFEGLTCFECGENVPKVWLETHNATNKKMLSELQMLLLGVNAHINYDLVLSLYDMLRCEWTNLSEAQINERFEDHCYVNSVIAKTIDRVQDEILEPLNPTLQWADRIFFRLDEYLISKLIRSWRNDVWEKSVKLLGMKDDNEREVYRREIEQDVLKLGNTICIF
jgi:hypothetical protein